MTDTDFGTEVDGNIIASTEEREGFKPRCFGFTVFKEGWNNFWIALNRNTPEKVYWAYKPEICPNTGREHWHAIVYYKNPQNWKNVRKAFEPCYTLIVKKIDKYDEYVKKEETKNGEVVSWGEIPQQGRRNDLEEIAEKILEGKNVDDLADEYPVAYIRYTRGLKALENTKRRNVWRTWQTECDYLVGGTRVGKSHRAFEGYNPRTHYLWKNDGGWWDNYEGQETVILNDFRGEIAYNELLQMIDKWPYDVRRRGLPRYPF